MWIVTVIDEKERHHQFHIPTGGIPAENFLINVIRCMRTTDPQYKYYSVMDNYGSYYVLTTFLNTEQYRILREKYVYVSPVMGITEEMMGNLGLESPRRIPLFTSLV